MPFDNITDTTPAFAAVGNALLADRTDMPLQERRARLLKAAALADEAGPMITRDEWKQLALALAAVVPVPRKTPDAKAKAVDDLQHLTTRLANVFEHDVEPGFYLPRYSPHGYPEPIWSDADLTRPDARRFGSTGKQLLTDRRKPWQRETKARFDVTGSVCTSLG